MDLKGRRHAEIKGHIARERYVPIYYVPCNPVDHNRRDSLGYSVLHGARMAVKVSSSLSMWTIPNKYFVVPPFAAYNAWEFLQFRDQFRAPGNFFLMADKSNSTVRQNMQLPFLVSPAMINACRKDVHDKSTSMWVEKQWDLKNRTVLPEKEQYSARFFTFAEVFEKIPEGLPHLHLSWYHQITNWEEYETYLKSENYLKRPAASFMPKSTPMSPLSEAP